MDPIRNRKLLADLFFNPGDEFDMSQDSQCMTIFFNDYPRRSRKFKMWKSVVQTKNGLEIVEQLTRKHKQTLLKLLEENYDDLPDAVTRRAKLFWNFFRNRDADSKKKLMDMSTVGPFWYDQAVACLNWIQFEFDDILNQRLTQMYMYVTKVLMPTVFLLLFNDVTEISLDATEKVLHDGANADIDWESVLAEQPSL